MYAINTHSATYYAYVNKMCLCTICVVQTSYMLVLLMCAFALYELSRLESIYNELMADILPSDTLVSCLFPISCCLTVRLCGYHYR